MNKRYNMIEGCRASVTSATLAQELAGRMVLDKLIELDDHGHLTSEISAILRPYRATTEDLADTYEQFADSMRSYSPEL